MSEASTKIQLKPVRDPPLRTEPCATAPAVPAPAAAGTAPQQAKADDDGMPQAPMVEACSAPKVAGAKGEECSAPHFAGDKNGDCAVPKVPGVVKPVLATKK